MSFLFRYLQTSYKYGIRIGDPLWFIDRIVRLSTENGFVFGLLYFLLAFLSGVLTSTTYMLKYKPNLNTVLRLGPIYSNYMHCLLCILPLFIQKDQYRKIMLSFRSDFWRLIDADAQSHTEIRAIHRNGMILLVSLYLFCFTGDSTILPWFGLNYDNTIWPTIKFLAMIKDPSNWLILSVAIITFVTVYPLTLTMITYALHFMHVCELYRIQYILLKQRLRNMRYCGRIDDVFLNDNGTYQRWIKNELVECIRHHYDLKKFGRIIVNYFEICLFFQMMHAIFLFTMLSYIVVFQSEDAKNALTFKMELLCAVFLLFLYAHYAEIFESQKEEARSAFYNIPWNTFNIENKKIFLIYSPALDETQGIKLVFLTLNYNSAVWVCHKVINYLTILSQLES